eukprot:6133222-Amphidinium_carterae.3
MPHPHLRCEGSAGYHMLPTAVRKQNFIRYHQWSPPPMLQLPRKLRTQPINLDTRRLGIILKSSRSHLTQAVAADILAGYHAGKAEVDLLASDRLTRFGRHLDF